MATSLTLPGGQSLRDNAEVAVPGAAIGLMAGLFAMGVGMMAGLPLGVTLTIAAGLGVPLALFGAGYCVLLARGVFGIGAVAPLALYWFIGFPLARLIDSYAVATVLGSDTVLDEPLLSFLALQAMLSFGFTIGFLWLHERIAPRWLIRVRDHNAVAAGLVERYMVNAAHLNQRRRAKGPRRKPSNNS